MNVSIDIILAGALDTLTWFNILLIATGSLLGLVIGCIPGLNGPMAIAIAIPVTFYLQPIAGIGLLIGIMKGSTIGGAISAIIMNTPGTPDAMVTTNDGYPMAQKGQSGKALKAALYSSVTGDSLSDLVLFLAAAPLAVVAIMMGPVEQTGVVFFSICILASLVGGKPLRGLIAACFGFVLATIGQSLEEATPRITYGIAELENGLPLVGVGMGVLVFGEIIHSLMGKRHHRNTSLAPISQGADANFTWREYFACRRTLLRSASIGTVIGAVPGIGSALAATLSYALAKRRSKQADKFGTGVAEGVVATEAANSAVSGANLIPLLTLGIPGNVSAAFLMGALIIHGIIPGPTLLQDEPRLIYSLFTAMVIANISNLILGRLGLGLFAKLAQLRAVSIYPAVILLCMVGAYVSGGGPVGLVVLGVFGVVGYVLRVLKFPIIIFIIAFVLGRILESPLTQTIILIDHQILGLLDYPIAIAFMLAGIGLLLYVLITQAREARSATQENS